MRKRLSALLLSAAVASAVGAFAEGPPGTGQIDGAAATDASPSTPPASTTLRMRGTVGDYDATTRTLSISTSSGTVKFRLAPTARIRQGWHKVDAVVLQKLAGYRATVRYSESGGNKTVESVQVSGK